MPLDVIIEKALIYDGTGRAPVRNDVGIQGDRIASVGNLSEVPAVKRIDARNLALSPGFIDVHSHADMTLHRADHHKYLEPLVRQGITTFVGGNCGVGMGPISDKNPDIQYQFYNFFLGEDIRPHLHWKSYGELLDHYENQGLLLNSAVLVGHGILRMDAMGDSTERASMDDVRCMQHKLAECLEAGGIGLSTGLMYFPGLSSDEHELTQLARTVHDYNGVFTSHLRSYNSDTLMNAIDEVLEIGRSAEVPVQISHLFWVHNFPEPLGTAMKWATKGLSYLYNKKELPIPLDGATKPFLKRVAQQIEQGFPVGVDAMPTTAGFTHLLAFFPPWSLQGGEEAVKKRISDKTERKKIRQSIENGQPIWPHRGPDQWSMNFFKVMGWDCAFVMSVVTEKNQRFIGKNFVQIGDELGKHPFDAACDMLLEEDARVLIFETSTYPGDPLIERSLYGTLLDPNVSIVTDTILLGFGRPSHLF